MFLQVAWRDMIQRTLPYWLVVLALVAFQWPRWAELVGWGDPWTWLYGQIQWMIVVTMFCVGLLLPREQVSALRRLWWAVLFGVLVQYTSMPLLAWSFGQLFDLPADAFLGVVLVGCVPGAMASNVLTLNAQGHVGYSVSLTTLATLVSPVAVPAGLLLALGRWHYDPILARSALFVTWTVVLPVLTGYFLARTVPAEYARSVTAPVANLAILLIIASVVAKSRSQFYHLGWLLPVTLLVINVAGYLAGYIAAYVVGLSEPMRRALTIEIGMQNAGLGAALAAHLFPDRPQIAVAPALYSFGCMLTGTLLSHYWSGRPPSGSTPE